MNVLMFVMTMLMLLALMTYARLDMFRSSQVFQTVFQYYMEEEERSAFNKRAIPIYNTIKVATKNGTKGSKAEGSPRLGIALLVNKKGRESKSSEWQQTRLLLKNLITTLYGEQPFFKKALEERPSLVDDLINAIAAESDQLTKDKKIKQAADLANLKLQDNELDQVLYKILQGSAYREITPEQTGETTWTKQEESPESEVDQSLADEALASESNEYKSAKGYHSLLDYVTLSSSPKIRVFLAPRPVLQAIYQNRDIVQSIIDERKRYYKQAMHDGDTKELSAAFKAEFDRQKDPAVSDESLNFSVTKTNPKYYE